MSGDTTLPGQAEELPYRIELWREPDEGGLERVLARASSPHLARAIFEAAKEEHPQRRIVLRKDKRTLAQS